MSIIEIKKHKTLYSNPKAPTCSASQQAIVREKLSAKAESVLLGILYLTRKLKIDITSPGAKINLSIYQLAKVLYGNNSGGRIHKVIKEGFNILVNKAVRVKDFKSNQLLYVPAFEMIGVPLDKPVESGKITIVFNPIFVELYLKHLDSGQNLKLRMGLRSDTQKNVFSYVSSLPKNCKQISFQKLYGLEAIGFQGLYKNFVRLMQSPSLIRAIAEAKNIDVQVGKDKLEFKYTSNGRNEPV